MVLFGVLSTSLIVVGCDDPQNSGETGVPKLESNKVDNEAPKNEVIIEETKKDLRIIGDGKLPAPKITEDTVERIKPPIKAVKKNALETPRKPKKPVVFSSPIAVTAGVLVSKDITITLDDIKAPNLNVMCKSAEGDWPCGNFAKFALQRLIRSRSVMCDGEWQTDKAFHGKCKVAKRDLATWLLEQGWATTDNKNFKALELLAKNAKKGLWRD
jgi:endonuclease YncB( thermonuclease family)